MASLIDRFLSHADKGGERIAFTTLDRKGSYQHVTFSDLSERSSRVAGFLHSHTSAQDVVGICLPTGIDFVAAFLGCLISQRVAVPMPMPAASRGSKTRTASIVKNCQPSITITTAALATGTDGISAAGRVIGIDQVAAAATSLAPRQPQADIAYLQYTSGSTSDPKGVQITHRNLTANLTAIAEIAGHNDRSVGVSWLPNYHDMGLIGGILQPLYVGFPCVLLDPQDFLAAPIRWLSAIDQFRGSTTVAPNFAYDYCVDRIPVAETQDLDLSSLRVAFNGSEPLRLETLDRFTRHFQSCGFQRRAFVPCYGMAEATLLMTANGPELEPVAIRADAEQLEAGVVKPPQSAHQGRELISSGTVIPNHEIWICDPRSQRRLPAYCVGEICLMGPSVAKGYWTGPSDHVEIAGDHDAEGDQLLRSGDLGFVDGSGRLFVTGRLKEMIIVRGRNIYPTDIEATIARHLQLSAGHRVAASCNVVHEQVDLFIECNGALRQTLRANERQAQETSDHVRRLLQAEHSVPVGTVRFLRPGALPRTSSGKLKRHACHLVAQEPKNVIFASESLMEEMDDEMTQMLAEWIAGVTDPTVGSASAAQIAGRSLNELGLDSLSRSALVAELERKMGIVIDPRQFDPDVPIQHLVSRLKVEAQASTLDGPALDDESPIGESPIGPTSAESDIDSTRLSLSDFDRRESRDLISKTEEFRYWLKDSERRGHKRYLLPVIEHRGGRSLVGGDQFSPQREVVLFASADYLGLAHDPRVKQAAADAILEHGCNVASVPLIAGSTPVHTTLEERLSEMLGMEACVLFPTGHSANMATIAALCSPNDTVVVDNRVHYSILEGAKLAHASWRTFLHNNADSLQQVLESVRSQNGSHGILVIVEGVYGIEGDLANIDQLIEVARRYDARVMVDDAHGIGVLGRGGAGTINELGCHHRPDIIMGSLSKAFGSFGGFIVASKDIIEYLRFFAKSISFAVGMPTSMAAAALEGVRIVQAEPERLLDVMEKARWLRDALVAEGFSESGNSQSTIMSLLIGDEPRLREVVRELYDQGVWAEGLPFPAVSRGQERLRFRVRYEHQYEDLELAVSAVARVCGRPNSSSGHLQTGSRFAMVGNRPRPRTNDTLSPRVETVDRITVTEADAMSEMAIRLAKRHAAALPWISKEFIAKYYRRSEYWSAIPTTTRWHFMYDPSDRFIGACVSDETEVHVNGRLTKATLLGSLLYEHDDPRMLIHILQEVISRLDDGTGTEVFAPASFPVPIFGSGIQRWNQSSGKPFLESTLPDELNGGMLAAGFGRAQAKKYYRIRLRPFTAPLSPKIHIRDFDRYDYVGEIHRLIPIFNSTLGRLELCNAIPPETLIGLIQDLRELINPGFWLVAEAKQKAVGFLFCYPNLTEEFRRIGGTADIADYSHIQDSMDNAKEAFIAWSGVAPPNQGQGVSAAMFDAVRTRLLERGYTHTWISWEIVDGAHAVENAITRLGDIVDVAEMPYYVARPAASDQEPVPRTA